MDLDDRVALLSRLAEDIRRDLLQGRTRVEDDPLDPSGIIYWSGRRSRYGIQIHVPERYMAPAGYTGQPLRSYSSEPGAASSYAGQQSTGYAPKPGNVTYRAPQRLGGGMRKIGSGGMRKL